MRSIEGRREGGILDFSWRWEGDGKGLENKMVRTLEWPMRHCVMVLSVVLKKRLKAVEA